MKINFPALFRTPLQKHRFFFIYGNDTHVMERCIAFLQKKVGLPLKRLEESAFLTHTGGRADVQSSLFGGTAEAAVTLVWPVSDKILSQIDQVTSGITIFVSEKARATSKLVTYFAQSPVSLAIGAYASPVLVSEFETLVANMNLPASFKGALFKAFQNDYQGLLTTLALIKLYGDISESDFDSFLTPSRADEDLTPLLHALLVKNTQKAATLFSLINAAELVPVCRALSRSFLILHELMPFRGSPKSIQWMKITPPVFFKDQPIYEAALSKWGREEVHAFLETLLDLEKRVKFGSMTPAQMHHVLVTIALNSPHR